VVFEVCLFLDGLPVEHWHLGTRVRPYRRHANIRSTPCMIRVPPWQRRLELGQKPKVVSPVPAQTSRTRTWLRGGTKLLFSTYLLPVHLWRLCTTQLRACNARRIFASMMLYQAACTYVSYPVSISHLGVRSNHEMLNHRLPSLSQSLSPQCP
jgi:hypothetical protein